MFRLCVCHGVGTCPSCLNIATLDALVAELDSYKRHACDNWRYCKGGTSACEDCVGSCGVEEFDEHWEAVKKLKDEMAAASEDA